MKDMSVEELLDDLCFYADLSDEHYAIEAELLRRFEALEKEVEKHKRTAICMYCGTVQQTKDGQEKLTMIIEHMAVCEKHPVPILLAKIATLEKELESWRNSKDGIMAENEALAAAAIEKPPYKEDLKCCGNCGNETRICGYWQSEHGCNGCCDKWQTDGLSRAEREGK